MFSKLAIVVAVMLGASLVEAHLVMVNPVPYNSDPSNNSPLDASGSNFPCKTTGDYAVVEENYMTKGESQSMIFHGSTTHGGGSCQISITPDRAPSKDTTWSVIKSIEGGCMDETESDVNMGKSSTMVTPFSPNFTIPNSFQAGEYTIAWTWFNRLGNREMYMNCAPITITESISSSKRSGSAEIEKRSPKDFPPLFIANINGCLTKESYAIRFPNPGNTVDYLGLEENLIARDDDVCFSGSANWGKGCYSSTEDSVLSAKTSSSAKSFTTATDFRPYTVAGSTAESLVSGPLTSNAANYTTECASSTKTAPIAPASVVSVSIPTAHDPNCSISVSRSSSNTLVGSCSEEGIWNCIGGTSWQRCAGGIWTPKQPMADGTECTPGLSKDFSIKSASSKSLKNEHSKAHRHGAPRHS
ncbi:hypothetical protein N7450_011589 [Penicillium hetheringtonii]|uniref:Lytic polysaccharide monooxygenase n=1 Tax=Penicillium hetheringtonii TaxID=911720 RepID=A0AAD6GM06_9EURO|nr:hypothetical protein N7450_011589 [Penicillium hetheringtonii]